MKSTAEFRGVVTSDGGRVVTYEGLALPLFPAAAAHARTFEWGSGGAEARALAAAILTVVLPSAEHVELLTEVFVWRFVAGWGERGFSLQEQTVREWAALRLKKYRWAERMAFPRTAEAGPRPKG